MKNNKKDKERTKIRYRDILKCLPRTFGLQFLAKELDQQI